MTAPERLARERDKAWRAYDLERDAHAALLARLRAFREYLDLAPGSPITIGRICAAFDADFPNVRDE